MSVYEHVYNILIFQLSHASMLHGFRGTVPTPMCFYVGCLDLSNI